VYRSRVYRAGETARREIVGGSRRRCGRQAEYRDEMFRRPRNDPANPAQVRPLKHMPERVFSCTYGSGDCRVIGQSFLENIRFGSRQRSKVSEQFIRCQDLAVFTDALAAFFARSAFGISRSMSSLHACAAPFVNPAWWWGSQTALGVDQCRLSPRRVTLIFKCA
jgi:hypothetical protein